MKFIIIALIIALIAVMFALQNAQTIIVKLLFWDLSGSMALVMLITLFIGIISGMLVLVPNIYRKNSAINSQKKKISELEKQLTDASNKNYR